MSSTFENDGDIQQEQTSIFLPTTAGVSQPPGANVESEHVYPSQKTTTCSTFEPFEPENEFGLETSEKHVGSKPLISENFDVSNGSREPEGVISSSMARSNHTDVFSLKNVNVVVPHSPISNEVTENLGHAPAQEQDPHRSIHPEGMNVHQQLGLVEDIRDSNSTHSQDLQNFSPKAATSAMLGHDVVTPNFMQSRAILEASRVHGASPLEGMREPMMADSPPDPDSVLRTDFSEHGRVHTMRPMEQPVQESLRRSARSLQPEGDSSRLKARSTQGYNISKAHSLSHSSSQEMHSQFLPLNSDSVSERDQLRPSARSPHPEGVEPHFRARSRENIYGHNISNSRGLSPGISREMPNLLDVQRDSPAISRGFLRATDRFQQREVIDPYLMAHSITLDLPSNIPNFRAPSPHCARKVKLC